jgi:hypothetical protein
MAHYRSLHFGRDDKGREVTRVGVVSRKWRNSRSLHYAPPVFLLRVVALRKESCKETVSIALLVMPYLRV